MPSALQDQVQTLPLAGGLTALELWPATNLVLLGWLLLVFLPGWEHTKTLSLVPPILHSAIYVVSNISLMRFPSDPTKAQPDFTKLEGVVEMFQDANVVFVGWLHYLVFDLLIGRWIVEDSIDRGASVKFHIFAVVPCLFFTFFLGPTGWLMYMILRSLFLPSNKPNKIKQK